MKCFLMWLAICTTVVRAQDVRFSILKPSCEDGPKLGIQCDLGAHDDDAGVLQLTTHGDPSGTGYVFYQDRVRMRDDLTGQAASFSTRFIFRIVTEANVSAGDGMAFVMFSDKSFRGSAGGPLGVYLPNGTEGTKTFCVEYDTFLNPGVDPNDNHVGVDLENMNSKTKKAAQDAGIRLAGGYPITTWIDYNFTTLTLEVRITNFSHAKPFSPFITYGFNLAEAVDEFMSIGLSASTGSSRESHELLDWSFASFGLLERSISPLPSVPPSGGNTTGSTVEQGRDKISTALILRFAFGGAAGATVIILISVGCCVWWVKKWSRSDEFQDEAKAGTFQNDLSAIDMPTRFTYRQLSAATDGFSDASRLGQGGFGSVYQGRIPSTGALVAVKKVANRQKRGENEFLNEITAVSRLRHRNLVQLLGFCIDHGGGNYLIVYELMPLGSLDKLLYCNEDDDECEVLPWTRRFAIVREVAAGLAYAHKGTAKQIIHRDVKSSNVMMDENFTAKLGDFGLARLIEHSSHNHKSFYTHWAGTVGYIAPEAITGKCTDKWDVYGFGALVLEIASARRPIDKSRPEEEWLLVDWVRSFHTEDRILDAADPRLSGKFPSEEMTKLLLLGLLCTHANPEIRPSMRDVELILAGYIPLSQVPPVEEPVVRSPNRSLELSREHLEERIFNSI